MLNIQPAEKKFLKFASISVAVLAVVNVWTFYKNEFWSPKIIIKSVDYKKGVAELEINGRPFRLRGDSSYLIGYDWGIKFGTTKVGNKQVYDRIEVLKRNMVHKVLRSANDSHE